MATITPYTRGFTSRFPFLPRPRRSRASNAVSLGHLGGTFDASSFRQTSGNAKAFETEPPA
jgi:hypothetical protein